MKTFYRPFVRFLLSLACVVGLSSATVQAFKSSNPSSMIFGVLNKTLGISSILDLINIPKRTQTISYLAHEPLRTKLNGTYSDRINQIGKDYFTDLFKTIVQKEVEFNNDYRVFYHGQDRIFMLFHDLYKGLYELVKKKKLHDFIMLRIPSTDFKKFTTIQKFLAHYINNSQIYRNDFDEISEVRTQLLCLNASLFGNTQDWGECTFDYFLNSFSIGKIDIMGLVKKVFASFNIEKLFSKYEKKLEEMSSLLKSSETNKTGALLQIFIPNTLVDKLAYRCKPWGLLYYTDKHPELHPASFDLDEYKTSNTWNPWTLDATQFRLLINESTLDPESGIKMFRYGKETAKVQIYKQKFENLLNIISKDIAKEL